MSGSSSTIQCGTPFSSSKRSTVPSADDIPTGTPRLGWSVMNEHSRWQGLATKAIHAGFRPDPQTGAVNAPIYASSTFAQDGVGGLRGGFEYRPHR